MIEVLTRLRLPIVPVDPDDVARKADITLASGAVTADEVQIGQTFVVTTAVGGYPVGSVVRATDTVLDFIKHLLDPPQTFSLVDVDGNRLLDRYGFALLVRV